MSSDLDRSRAASASTYSASLITVGDEPMLIDLAAPIFSDTGKHSLAWAIAMIVSIPSTGRPPDVRGIPPNSGLFLCPPATPPETESQAISGLYLGARPLPLPLNDPYLNVANVGAGWSVQIVAALPRLMVIPRGWFIRGILNCQQGGATPGPGAGSNGILTALISSETNQDLSRC